MPTMRFSMMLLYLTLSGLLCTGSFAQELVFTNITTAIGLPAHECYNVVQDAKGYIWISTENGLCRYNGNKIRVYSKSDGLENNIIYYLGTGSDGQVKAITAENTVFSYKNDSFKAEKYSVRFKQKSTKVVETGYYIYQLKDSDILSTYGKTYKANRDTGALTVLSDSLVNKEEAITIVCEPGNSYIIRNIRIDYTNSDRSSQTITLSLVSGQRKKTMRIPFGKSRDIDSRMRVCESNGCYFLTLHNKLIKITPSLEYTVYDYPSKILSLQPDGKKGLWVGLFQKGLYHYNDSGDFQKYTTALREYSITGVLRDRENSIWATTLEKGIFYCGNAEALSYTNIPELHKLTPFLKTIGNSVFASSGYDNLFIINNGKAVQKEMSTFEGNDFTDIMFYDDHWYMANKSSAKIFDRDFQNGKYIMINGGISNQYRFGNYDGQIYAISAMRIGRIDNYVSKTLNFLRGNRVRDLLCVNATTFYIGDQEGLLHFNPKTNNFKVVEGINASVSKIVKAHNGTVLTATKGSGLYVIENGKGRRISFGKSDIDFFFDIEQEPNSDVFWASTESGLISFVLKNGKPIIKNYSAVNGLISADVQQLAISGKTLYASTVDGLCSVQTNIGLDNDFAPPIYVDAFYVNGKLIKVKDKMAFNHDQNTIQVVFDALTFKRSNGALLYYRLSGDRDDWKTSETNELRFDNLLPNDYELTVYAVNNDGIKSIKPIVLHFTIEKPFWQELWFVLLLIIVVATVLCVIILNKINNIRLREADKTRINKLISESQLSALQAQMNPHFIFNAISSIQNYILKHDEVAAYDYLAKFGKLIRMVLNNSREKVLYLYQELETLELYIELEQQRFGNSFGFRIDIDKSIDMYTAQLPAMLIQPYIENAIWHGLMQLGPSAKPFLFLGITEEGDMLKITVEDNGIGRRQSAHLKEGKIHHPVGMQLTQQRLEMLHKMKGYEGIQYEITDLYNENGEPSGTRVTIFVPLNTDTVWKEK